MHLRINSGRLIKIQISRLYPRASYSIGVGWGPRICISTKSHPADADVAVLGITAENHKTRAYSSQDVLMRQIPVAMEQNGHQLGMELLFNFQNMGRGERCFRCLFL